MRVAITIARTHEEAIFLYQEESRARSLRLFRTTVTWWMPGFRLVWPMAFHSTIFRDGNKTCRSAVLLRRTIWLPREILFFWVARMIIAGYEYRGEKPFSNVYLTGGDKVTTWMKMSKSLGVYS